LGEHNALEKRVIGNFPISYKRICIEMFIIEIQECKIKLNNTKEIAYNNTTHSMSTTLCSDITFH
jgi:hypothetical protein